MAAFKKTYNLRPRPPKELSRQTSSTTRSSLNDGSVVKSGLRTKSAQTREATKNGKPSSGNIVVLSRTRNPSTTSTNTEERPAAESETQPSSPLLRLPPEIQLQIYKLVLNEPYRRNIMIWTYIDSLFANNTGCGALGLQTPMRVPSLLLVNRDVFNTAAECFYEDLILEVNCDDLPTTAEHLILRRKRHLLAPLADCQILGSARKIHVNVDVGGMDGRTTDMEKHTQFMRRVVAAIRHGRPLTYLGITLCIWWPEKEIEGEPTLSKFKTVCAVLGDLACKGKTKVRYGYSMDEFIPATAIGEVVSMMQRLEEAIKRNGEAVR